MTSWTKFIETGFLTHKQTGIRVYLYVVNPYSVHQEIDHLSEFIQRIKPSIVGLQMVYRIVVMVIKGHKAYYTHHVCH